MAWIWVGVVIVFTACGKSDAPPTEPPPAPVAATPVMDAAPDVLAPRPIIVPEALDPGDASTWKVYAYDGFSIEAPYRVDATGLSIEGVTAHQYVYGNMPGNMSMLVQVTHLPFAVPDPEPVLAEGRDGAIPRGGKVTAERRVTVAGVEGLDVSWKGKLDGAGKVAGRTRVFVRDGRLYQIQTLWPAGKTGRPDLADKFVESFVFMGDAP